MARFDSVRRKPKDTKGTFLRMISYMGQYKKILVLIFLMCFVSNVLALLGPTLAGRAINEAAAGIGADNVRHLAEVCGVGQRAAAEFHNDGFHAFVPFQSAPCAGVSSKKSARTAACSAPAMTAARSSGKKCGLCSGYSQPAPT